MRVNIMFGLNHAEHKDIAHFEAARLLADLADKLNKDATALNEGDAFILRDINGNRVGVMDVFKD